MLLPVRILSIFAWRIDRSDHMVSKTVQTGATPVFSAIKTKGEKTFGLFHLLELQDRQE